LQEIFVNSYSVAIGWILNAKIIDQIKEIELVLQLELMDLG